MDLPTARHLAETLLAEHGLSAADPPWTFRFNRRKRALGTCHYGPRRIELSTHFVVANDADEVRDTVLHEIAHALAGPATGHGPAWKAACVRIGARPERLAPARVAMPAGRWRAACPGCGATHSRHRRPLKGRAYFCRTCGAERGALTFRRNENPTRPPGG